MTQNPKTQNPKPDPDANSERIAPNVVLPDHCLRFTFARSGGPGGQNVNKLSTKAILTVTFDDLFDHGHLHPAAMRRLYQIEPHLVAKDPDRLIITCDQSRSQLANRKACLAKLRMILTHAIAVPKSRIPTRPSRGSVRRRLEEKRKRSKIKQQRNNPGPQD